MASQSGYILLNKGVEEYLRQTFPQQESERFEELLRVLTTPPLFTTLRITPENTSGLMTKLKTELSKQCTALQWSVFEQFVHPALKDCIIIKNRGPFDLEKCSKEIIVDTSCAMAVLRGANIFKQGIMGAPHSLMKDDKVAVYADLDGKCLKGTSSLYQGNKRHIGNGISQVSRKELFNTKEIQTGIGILMTEPLYQAPSLSELDTAIFFPQNLPSIVCGHVLDPQPGEVILDMCAAPGGKTTHIASLMNRKGRVVALEKSGERATRMQETIRQMGDKFDTIEVYAFDSTKAVSNGEENIGAPPYPPTTFDRILLDAPCSALGQRPCLANRMHLNQIKSFPVLQRKLLMVAVELLKPGGVLVYSTCTIPREENEDQVSHVLHACPDLELVDSPFNSSHGGIASSHLSEEDRSKVIRFDPTNAESNCDSWDRDTIGFFIAKFRKKEFAGIF